MNWVEDDEMTNAVVKEAGRKAAEERRAVTGTAGEVAYALMMADRAIEELEDICSAYREQLITALAVDTTEAGEVFHALGPIDVTVKIGERTTWDQEGLNSLMLTSTTLKSLLPKVGVDTKALAKADPAERSLIEAYRTKTVTKPKVTVKER